MEHISFSERAKWYNIETYNHKQNMFLNKLLVQNKCVRPIVIPCTSGKNLIELSKISKEVIGYDIDSEMIKASKQLIIKHRVKNVKILYGNMLEFDIPEGTDSILILNEAIQMFSQNSSEFKSTLINILKYFHGILVLEVYDYKNSLARDNLKYFSYKDIDHIVRDFSFIFEKNEIIRFHKSTFTNTGIQTQYYYRLKGLHKKDINWKTSYVKMYNIDIEKLIEWLNDIRHISYILYTSYNFEYDPVTCGKRVIIIDCK